MGIGLGLVMLALLARVAWMVEDWGRDLSHNMAETLARSEDPLLRPVLTSSPVEVVEGALREFVAAQPSWSFVDATGDDPRVIRLTRRTAWLRFTDDVTVTIAAQGEQTRVGARSQSRLGKGDFGQNPRNLRQLVRALQAALPK